MSSRALAFDHFDDAQWAGLCERYAAAEADPRSRAAEAALVRYLYDERAVLRLPPCCAGATARAGVAWALAAREAGAPARNEGAS